jgi:hypothetical protein
MPEISWITGGCLCGDARYEVDPAGAFDAGYCHCSMCRRSTGAPVVAWALVKIDAFRILKGNLRHYQSSSACIRSFCSVCGSQLIYKAIDVPEMIGFHVATLDGLAPVPLRPRLHMFSADQISWFELNDDLPRFVDNKLSHPDRR